jgi:hypothetical protein
MRVLSTTRGVGCLEVGRLLDGKLGVLARDGAFGDDGRFHELPAGGLASGGQCANLDAHGRLFYTVSNYGIQASGWIGHGSCVVRPPSEGAPPPGYVAPRPPTGYCPTAELRDLFSGLLGPEATTVTYRLDGRLHTLRPAGAEGAYLIVGRHSAGQSFHGRHPLGGGVTGIMPLPWASPIVRITYRYGFVCRIADTQPGTLKGRCTPPGYAPARPSVLAPAQVASPLGMAAAGAEARRLQRPRGARAGRRAAVSDLYLQSRPAGGPFPDPGAVRTGARMVCARTPGVGFIRPLLRADLPPTHSCARRGEWHR